MRSSSAITDGSFANLRSANPRLSVLSVCAGFSTRARAKANASSKTCSCGRKETFAPRRINSLPL